MCLLFLAVKLLVVPEQAHAESLSTPARDVLLDALLALHPLVQREHAIIFSALLDHG